MYSFNFAIVIRNLPFLMTGLGWTIKLALMAIAGAIVVGLFVSLLRLSKLPVISQIARFYVDFFQSTPLLVQLIWIYYALPILLNISLSAYLSTVLALWLKQGAFLAEIFRAGIQSINRGQSEAAFVLGLTKRQALADVILPQAFARMLPPIGSNLVVIVKDSSLASFLAVPELTYQATVLQSSTFRPIEVLTVLALIYFVVNYPLGLVVSYLEERVGSAERH